MSSSNSPAPLPPLAERGTSAYFPSLLAAISTAHPTFPLDPVILQSLLLGLIARIDASGAPTPSPVGAEGDARPDSGWACANLILRTREEDVAMLVHIVSLTLTTVFGLTTHKRNIPARNNRPGKGRPRRNHDDPVQPPEALLRTLFFRRPSSSASLRLSGDVSARSMGGSKPSRSPPPATQRPLSQTPRPSGLRMSRSIDNEGADDVYSDQFFDGTSIASSRRPLMSGSTPMSTLRSRRAQAIRLPAFPDGALLSSPMALHMVDPSGDRDEEDLRPVLTLPKAVVVSGLEHASLPAQRALSQVLADKRLVLEDNGGEEAHPDGTWNLPDDFLMVYVCKSDLWERPAVLGALLDKFAMSADITITPTLRQTYTSYRGTPGPTPHASPFATPHSLPTPTDYITSSTVRTPPARPAALSPQSRYQSTSMPPPISSAELKILRTLASPFPSGGHSYIVTSAFLQNYLRNLFYATRQHPLLEGTLLTRRSHLDADALIRAFRVLVGDSVGADLLRAGVGADAGSELTDTEDSRESGSADEATEWEKDISGIDWARQNATPKFGEGSIDGSDTGGPVRVDLPLPFGMPAAPDELGCLGDSSRTADQDAVQTWDLSEVDVARVFPRIVSHRLRVRGSPNEEILGSTNWPAVAHLPPHSTKPADEGTRERKTVKEVLVQILGDV